MTEPVRLITSQPKPVKACSTCRHRRKEWMPPGVHCDAVDQPAGVARILASSCGPDGRFWEARSPEIGVVGRLRRWLFGESS